MTIRATIATALVNRFAADFPGLLGQTDVTVPFTPPANAPWFRLAFIDGAEQFRGIGGLTTPAVQPVIASCDIRCPLSQGDGLAGEIADSAMNAWRRLKMPEGRWKRFEAGSEGVIDGDYRKLVMAVFWRTRRV